MTASFRILCALLAFLTCAQRHALAYSVKEMKEMEVKVKGLVSKNMPAVVALIGDKVPGSAKRWAPKRSSSTASKTWARR